MAYTYIDRLGADDLAEWRDICHERDAATFSPQGLTFERGKQIAERETMFLASLYERYELDDTEAVTVSVVTGSILYGEA